MSGALAAPVRATSWLSPVARRTRTLVTPRHQWSSPRIRGKTQREAIRCLKRHLVRRIYNLLRTPNDIPIRLCLT
jgi:hypothetical protein